MIRRRTVVAAVMAGLAAVTAPPPVAAGAFHTPPWVRPLDLSGHDFGTAIAVGADRSIVVAGYAMGGRHDRDSRFGVARLTLEGRLDPTFSRDGRVITRAGVNSGARDVATLPTGDVVVAGHAGSQLTV